MKTNEGVSLSVGPSQAKLAAILRIVEGLRKEFPGESVPTTLDQETLEVALDDVVIQLISAKLLSKDFAKNRTFSRAFASLFGESSSLYTQAMKLQMATASYSDDFSPEAARSSFDDLVDALRKKIDESKEQD